VLIAIRRYESLSFTIARIILLGFAMMSSYLGTAPITQNFLGFSREKTQYCNSDPLS
jgi:hypothetical protein